MYILINCFVFAEKKTSKNSVQSRVQQSRGRIWFKMPATIIVPGGGGECSSKRHRVQSSFGTCSPSPKCSKSSIMTESLPTSRVTMRPQAPSDDFFSDSSLIFVPPEEKKSTRETPSKKVQKAWQFGSTDIRYQNCEVKKVTKVPKPSEPHQVGEKGCRAEEADGRVQFRCKLVWVQGYGDC